MYVKILFVDEWHGRRCRVFDAKDPEWGLVSDSIAALDGVRKVMVSLFEREGGESCLIVSGQWGGRVMVNATSDDLSYLSVIDQSQPVAKRTLCVGGQDGEYDETRIVPIEWAMIAARTFYESGKLEPSLSWNKD